MREEIPLKKGLAAVKGTKDILPGEIEKWQALETLTRKLFETYGFREIRTPIIEPTELFEKGTGVTSDIVTKEMYTFIDKAGRSITLRPEYTPSVVRAIIEHRLDLNPEPLRFYYFGPMFRYDRPQKGRYRQFHQIDVEIFGEKDPAVDAELVEMADRLLGKLNISQKETLVNSVGCRQCRPGYSQTLRELALKKKNSFCPDCQRKAASNPLRIFDCKLEACQQEARLFPGIIDYLCSDCRLHFDMFLSYLDFYKINYKIDCRLVRGIDYYTKTTFEIISPVLGAQNAILGGGRYDDMMKEFGGPDLCGIGFAIGMERLLTAARLIVSKRKFLYAAYLGEKARLKAMDFARLLRSHEIETLVEYKNRGLKAHFSRANKLEAAWVLIIGEDEIKTGRFKIKQMSSGKQFEGTEQELLAVLLNLQRDEP